MNKDNLKHLKKILLDKAMNEAQSVTDELIEEMREACKFDHSCILDKKPALYRVQLSAKVQNMMQKKLIQNCFLVSNGVDILAEWIDVNPDGSFPLV